MGGWKLTNSLGRRLLLRVKTNSPGQSLFLENDKRLRVIFVLVLKTKVWRGGENKLTPKLWPDELFRRAQINSDQVSLF